MTECGPDTKVKTVAAAEPAAIELVTRPQPADNNSAVVDQGGANTPSVSPSTLASAYADFWRLLQSASRANGQPLPQLTLSARRLQVHHHAADHHDHDHGDAESHSADAKMPTLQRVLMAKLQGLDPRRLLGLGGRDGSPRTVQSLASASTLLLPGSLTLVLAPPGHGKTTLLRALAGRLHDATGQSSASASGLVADHSQLRWGGLTAAQLAAAGLQLPRLTAFVAQNDDHYPMLSVRETFRFAMQTNLADTCTLQSPELERARAGLVDAVIHTLGLTECADTNVGSSEVRGVSGGQRRRVSTGEMLLGCPRALLLDEVTSGLDAQTACALVAGLRQWARVASAPVVMALLQPTPEMVQLFDSIVLLKEGNIVFHGSQEQLLQHWSVVGVPLPPEGVSLAEWAVKLLAEPHVIMRGAGSDTTQTNGSGTTGSPAPTPSPSPSPSASPLLAADEHKPAATTEMAVLAAESGGLDGDVVRIHLEELHQPEDAPAAPAPPAAPRLRPDSCTAAGMLADWEASPLHAQLLSQIEALHASGSTTAGAAGTEGLGAAVPLPGSFVRAQFYQAASLPFSKQMPLLLGRELKAVARSVAVFSYRLFQATLMGLVLGSLFWQVGVDADSVLLRLALLFVGIMEAAFGCMAEVPSMIACKRVVLKQTEAGFFSEGPYLAAAAVAALPVSVAETITLGSLLYWLSNFAPSADRFFFFLLLQLLMGTALLALFRCVAFSTESAEIAIALINPLAGLMILLAGFLITRLKIPDWLIWLYWSNPFTWGLNSLALNEYGSPRYPPGQGDEFLRSFEISTDARAKWGGVGFLVVLSLLGSAVAALQLRAAKGKCVAQQHAPLATNEPAEDGAVAVDVGEEAAEGAPAAAESVQAEADAESAGAALPFERTALSFRDVFYSVQVGADDSSVAQQQLQQPQTQRQSSSGGGLLAGKVAKQLLRGITGFAKPGSITALMGSSGAGKTTLLDVLAQRKSSGTVTGSILLNGHAVSGAASTGRLLAYCEQADHHQPLATVREAIEFSAHLRLHADVTAEQRRAFVQRILRDLELAPVAGRLVSTLAPGALKRLTIGIELAANSPVLFLDEPTTGLDARSALVVMRVLRRVASSGRTIVCTVHTPSREVFLLFDRLLLLQNGGRCVYFGDIGRNGEPIVEHFTALRGPAAASGVTPALVAGPVGGAASPSVNVAVWMLDAMQPVGGAGGGDDGSDADQAGTQLQPQPLAFALHYEQSELRAANETVQAALEQTHSDNNARALAAGTVASSSSFAQPLRVQFFAVLHRLWLSQWRSGDFQLSKLSSCLILGLALGVVYYRISDDDEAGLQSRVAALLTAVVFSSLILACCTIAPFFSVREAFYRETASRTYHPAVHAATLLLVELPYIVVGVILLALPFYFLVGLEPDAGVFFHFLLVLFLCAVCTSLLYQLCCALLPTAGLAVMSSDMGFMFMFFFAGFLIPERDIPEGWRWFYHANFYPKGLIATVLPQWPCDANGVGRGCQLVRATLETAAASGQGEDGGGTVTGGGISKADWVSDFVSGGDGWEYFHLAYLALTALVMLAAFTAAVCKVSYRSR